MGVQLKFRHRIGLIVVLAALALAAVTIVALVLGQRSEQQLSGIENQYVPLLELDRDLKRTFEQIPKAFEDAATAADESRLSDADQLRAEFVRRLKTGARAIKDNGSDANMLEVAFLGYYDVGRAVSAALASDTSPAELGPKIEAMRDRQQAFAAQLDLATRPDRSRLAAAFQTARASQDTSIKINVAVACLALALMVFLSWQLARRTVKSLHAVSEGVERLARGDVGTEIDVPAGDEIGDLAREANRTAVRLRDYRELVEREAWIQTGLAELADRIAGELDPVTLGHNAIHHVATYVGAGSAAIYAVDGEGVFRLVERYGVESDAPAIASFRLGETVLGEAAVRGEVRTQPLPADNGLSKPSSGAALHHHVLVPLIHEARTLGVLELAMADAPSERTITLMNRVRGALGIAFEVAESRQEAKMLLIETQRQALAAETANKELEAFSYSVSHDLRAPLRGIDGFSQALAEDEAPNLTDRGRDYLRRIRAAAQRMAELIDDLL
ncbi:MAG: histidine kinase dimerization/phospho-acceptor domain-containing protein, partial [Kofleriaceae bacterium]